MSLQAAQTLLCNNKNIPSHALGSTGVQFCTSLCNHVEQMCILFISRSEQRLGIKSTIHGFVVPVISETLPFHVYVVQESLLWSFCLQVIDSPSYSAIYSALLQIRLQLSALLQIRLQLSQQTICWIKSKLPPLPFDWGDANCFSSDALEQLSKKLRRFHVDDWSD